jgi:hypothetical protein
MGTVTFFSHLTLPDKPEWVQIPGEQRMKSQSGAETLRLWIAKTETVQDEN